MRTVAVIQARMGSTRLPGKVLADIAGRPLILWTVAAVEAVAGIDALVVATTDRLEDDELVAVLERQRLRVHRGSAQDVLRRVADAVGPLEPDVVLRQTADNPYPDPDVMTAQLARLGDGFDYVGITGLPLGIGAEAVRAAALWSADREATEAADREHVLTFVHRRPERFAIGVLADPPAARQRRYTVDTPNDLAFARALATRLADPSRPAGLAELEAIVAADPTLLAMRGTIAPSGEPGTPTSSNAKAGLELLED